MKVLFTNTLSPCLEVSGRKGTGMSERRGVLFVKSTVSVRNRTAVAISLAFVQSGMLPLWT